MLSFDEKMRLIDPFLFALLCPSARLPVVFEKRLEIKFQKYFVAYNSNHNCDPLHQINEAQLLLPQYITNTSEMPENIFVFVASLFAPDSKFAVDLFVLIRNIIDGAKILLSLDEAERLLLKTIDLSRTHREPRIENDLYILLDTMINTRGAKTIHSAFSSYTLPDCTCLLPLAFAFNGTDRSNTRSNSRSAKMRFKFMDDFNIDLVVDINHILYKAIPQRCSLRKHESLLQENCKKSPHIFDFVSKIIFASVLGLYDTASVKANLAVRRKTINLINNGIVKTHLLDTFCETNREMLLYMIKEYLYEMINRSPAILRICKMQFPWEALKADQISKCDIIRDQINKNVDDPLFQSTSSLSFIFKNVPLRLEQEKERLKRAAQVVTSNNGQAKKKYNKQKQQASVKKTENDDDDNDDDDDDNDETMETQIKNPIDKILWICTEHNLTHYEIDKDNLKNGEEYLLEDPVPGNLLPMEHVHLMEDMLHALKKYILITHKTYNVDILPMSWLTLLGVAPEKLMLVRKVMYLNTTKLQNVFPQLSRYEYTVVYTFFKLHHSMNLYFEYPNDSYKYLMHMFAAQEMLNLKDGDRFPKDTAGSTLACDNCLELKNQVLYRKNSVGQIGRGAGDVMIDDFGRVVCARRPYKNDWKQTHKEKYGEYPEGPPVNKKDIRSTAKSEKRKTTKQISMQHMLNRCKFFRSRKVSGFGHDFTYDNINYFSCHKCLKVTSYENGYLNGCDSHCEDCMNKYTIQQKKTQELCEYCGQQTSTKFHDKRHSFFLYDDSNPVLKDQIYRQMYFCKSHGPMYWMKEHCFMFKSIAILGLKNQWGKKNLKGETIQVWTTNDGIDKSSFVHPLIKEYIQKPVKTLLLTNK